MINNTWRNVKDRYHSSEFGENDSYCSSQAFQQFSPNMNYKQVRQTQNYFYGGSNSKDVFYEPTSISEDYVNFSRIKSSKLSNSYVIPNFGIDAVNTNDCFATSSQQLNLPQTQLTRNPQYNAEIRRNIGYFNHSEMSNSTRNLEFNLNNPINSNIYVNDGLRYSDTQTSNFSQTYLGNLKHEEMLSFEIDRLYVHKPSLNNTFALENRINTPSNLNNVFTDTGSNATNYKVPDNINSGNFSIDYRRASSKCFSSQYQMLCNSRDNFASSSLNESYLMPQEVRSSVVNGYFHPGNDEYGTYSISNTSGETPLRNYSEQGQNHNYYCSSNLNKKQNCSKNRSAQYNRRRHSSRANKRSNPYKSEDRANLNSISIHSLLGKKNSRKNPINSKINRIKDRGNEINGINNFPTSGIQKKLVNDRSFPMHFITDFREFGLRKDFDSKIDNMLPKVYVDKALIAYEEFVRVLSTITSCQTADIRPGLLLTSLPNCDSCRLYQEIFDHYKSQNIINFFLMVATFPESGMCRGWAVVLFESKTSMVDFLVSSHFQWRGICVKVKPLLNIDLFFFNFKVSNVMFNKEEYFSQQNIVNMSLKLNELLLKNEVSPKKNASIEYETFHNESDQVTFSEYTNFDFCLSVAENGYRNLINLTSYSLEKMSTFFFSGKEIYLSIPPKKALKIVCNIINGKNKNTKSREYNPELVPTSHEKKDLDQLEIDLIEYKDINVNNIETCVLSVPSEDINDQLENEYELSNYIDVISNEMNFFPWGVKYKLKESKDIPIKNLLDKIRSLIRRLHRSCNHKWNSDIEYEGFIDNYLHMYGIKQLMSKSISDLIDEQQDVKKKMNTFGSNEECLDFLSLDFVLCIRGIQNLPKYNFESKIKKALKKIFDSFQEDEQKPRIQDFWSVELYIFPETERLRGDGIVLLPSYCNVSKFFSKISIEDISEKPNFDVENKLSFWMLPYNMYINQTKEELTFLLRLFARLISFWSYHVNGKKHPLRSKNKLSNLSLNIGILNNSETKRSSEFNSNGKRRGEIQEELMYKLPGYREIDLENLDLIKPPVNNKTDDSDVNGTLLGVEATADQWLNGLPKLVAEGIDERALDCNVMHFVRTFFFSAENFLSIYPFNSWFQLVNYSEMLDISATESETPNSNHSKDDLEILIRHPLPNQELGKNPNKYYASACNIIAEIISQEREIELIFILDSIVSYLNSQFGVRPDCNSINKTKSSILEVNINSTNSYREIEYLVTKVADSDCINDVSYRCKLKLKRWLKMGIEWNSSKNYKCPKASIIDACTNLLRHFAILEYRGWLISVSDKKKVDPTLLSKKFKIGIPRNLKNENLTPDGFLQSTSNKVSNETFVNNAESFFNSNLFLNTTSREALSIADKFEGVWNDVELHKNYLKVKCVALPSSLSFEESQKLISLEYLMRLIKAERMRLVPISMAFRTPLYRKSAYRYVQEKFRCDPNQCSSHLDHLWSKKCQDVVANSIELSQGKVISWLFSSENLNDFEIQDVLTPESCVNFLVNHCHYKQ